MSNQPFLHDTLILLAAPAQLIMNRDGRIGNEAEGFYHLDRRIFSGVTWRTSGRRDFIGHRTVTTNSSTFVHVLRNVGEPTPDPVVRVETTRSVTARGFADELVFTNAGASDLSIELSLELSSDSGRMDDIKAGRSTTSERLSLTGVHTVLTLAGTRVDIQVDGMTSPASTITVPAFGESQVRMRIALDPRDASLFGPMDDATSVVTMPEILPPSLLGDIVRRSVDDFRALLLTDSQVEGGCFAAAGAPWYLTLFGRDSIWAARMTLPLGIEVAMGTLRSLAARQALADETRAAAQPGKILHEVRESEVDLGGGVTLPPVYYGTIDATPLWMLLLHDTWLYDAPSEFIVSMLPTLKNAARWILRQTATDDEGFLRYIDATGSGLANQGWKDSADGVRNIDGTPSRPPIALCEVQGYAFAAMRATAEVARAFPSEWSALGDEETLRPAHLEAWSSSLASRFRARFWVDDVDGRYPAVAIDGDGRPVTALTSNIGHLLGTGILDREEVLAVAHRLLGDDLNSGYGLRTMASWTPGYNPLGYHTGSVWAHDTMIAARGLAAEGLYAEADALIDGVLAAAQQFEFRIPELYGGNPRTVDGRVLPYAASCFPQAWTAAAIVDALRILLRREPRGAVDPEGSVSPLLADSTVRGLRVGKSDAPFMPGPAVSR